MIELPHVCLQYKIKKEEKQTNKQKLAIFAHQIVISQRLMQDVLV